MKMITLSRRIGGTVFAIVLAVLGHIAVSAHAQTLTVTNGLTLWLKADAITGLTNGQAVAAWNDSSTNGNNATQSNPAYQPVYLTGAQNGHPVVEFAYNPGNTLVTPSMAPLANMSVFLVAKPTEGLNTYALSFDNNVAGLIYEFGSQPDPNKWDFYAGGFHELTPVTFYKYQVVSYTAASTATTGPWYVGSDVNRTAAFGGDFAEVIIYDRSLNVAEAQNVTEYLYAKWAIPEPATVGLLGFGALLLLRQRKS